MFLSKIVVCLFFGVLILLAPVFSMGMFGYKMTEPIGIVMARFYAVMLLGVAGILWFSSQSSPSDLRRKICLSLFIADTIGFIVALLAWLIWAPAAFTWIIVLIWMFLAAGLGYCYFTNQS